MTTLSPRAVGYVVVAALSLLVAVLARDPPLAAIGIACLVVLAAGLALPPPSTDDVEVGISLTRSVVTEGERTELHITVLSPTTVGRAVVTFALPSGVAADKTLAFLGRLPAGVPVELQAAVRASAPGRFELGPGTLRLSRALGLTHRSAAVNQRVLLHVRPIEHVVASLPRSRRVRVAAGDQLGRNYGEGIELAEVRAARPGEVVRRINWRATARRGVPHVTVRHPEQSTDVVLFLDTFDNRVIRRVLAVASTAAAGYLARRDRVGLVCFGGVLDWIMPGAGARQLERIRTRVASTSPFFSYAWKTIDRIPARALPAGALVIGVSALGDERFLHALASVRAKGHEVVVLEMATDALGDAGGADGRRDAASEAARLLVQMEKDDMRHRLFVLGIVAVPLAPGDPVELGFSMINEVRRSARMRALG